jgi:hypothetical protein
MLSLQVKVDTDPKRKAEDNKRKQAADDGTQFLETLKSMRPIGCIADPEEIANSVVWL